MDNQQETFIFQYSILPKFVTLNLDHPFLLLFINKIKVKLLPSRTGGAATLFYS